MPLREAVEVNCERSQLLQVKVQVPDIWAKGCVFDDCESLSLSLMEGESHVILQLIIKNLFTSFIFLP